MAQTGHLTQAPRAAAPWLSPVLRLRIAILLTILVTWEAVAASGILLRDVVPSIVTIGRALAELLFHSDLQVSLAGTAFSIPQFYWHLYVTILEVATALAIGGTAGLMIRKENFAEPSVAKPRHCCDIGQAITRECKHVACSSVG